jgi:hypothetical protein
MAGDVVIDGGYADRTCGIGSVIDCDVRRDALGLERRDEAFGIKSLVGAESAVSLGDQFGFACAAALGHGECCFALGCAGGRRQLAIDDQSVAVLHQRIAHEARLARLATALAKLPCIGIGCRGMELVRPLLHTEVALATAAARSKSFPATC